MSPWSFGSAHAARNEINSLKNLRTEYASLAKGTLTPTHFPIFLSSYIRQTVLVKNYKLFHTFEYDIDVDFTLTGNSFLFWTLILHNTTRFYSCTYADIDKNFVYKFKLLGIQVSSTFSFWNIHYNLPWSKLSIRICAHCMPSVVITSSLIYQQPSIQITQRLNLKLIKQ